MTEQEIRDRVDDVAAAALTAYAEARGDTRDGSSVEERIAVLHAIRNRAARSGRTVKDECLRPLQFSCWNPDGSRNHKALLEAAEAVLQHQVLDPLLEETLYLARGVLEGVILDTTRGATVYWAPLVMQPPGSRPKWDWSKLLWVGDVGTQKFYREV